MLNLSEWYAGLTPEQQDYCQIHSADEQNKSWDQTATDFHPYYLTLNMHKAMGFQVASSLQSPSVSDRERRLRLVLEEFLELVDAMGFQLCIDGAPANSSFEEITVTHVEGSKYDPVETLDALADLDVVINGTAVEFGLPMLSANREVYLSNMSKLLPDGKAAINGVTPGYREGEPHYRADAPIGKGLKGPNYIPPNIHRLIYLAGSQGSE